MFRRVTPKNNYNSRVFLFLLFYIFDKGLQGILDHFLLLLADVFSSYAKLKTEASESALRGFLAAFKNNAEQIQYAVESLTPPMNQQCEGNS